MIRFTFLSPLTIAGALAGVLAAQAPPPAIAPITTVPAATGPITVAALANGAQRPIDLAICLDISGSMEGLINAARQNLWAVVNDLATLRPTPTLRVALVTFGCSAHDAEKGWVMVQTPFTSDLDTVSEKLFALTTNGGEEYVARVMNTALEQLEWSNDPQALKLLFVAGNEAATQDPQVDGPSQSRAAIAKGIIVNSIYCGSPQHQDAPGWREVSKLADGQFATIEQDNGIVIATPFDAQLAELSTAINTTYVPYGAQRQVWAENQVRQDTNAAGLNPAAAAQRCQTKAGAFYDNGHWDLVDACRDAKFELDKVKKEELPEALRGLTIVQLRAHVDEQGKKRAELQKQVEQIGKQRDAHVKVEIEKLGDAGKRMFEQAVIESVRQQAEAKGFQRAETPATAPAKDCESALVPVVKEAVRDYHRFACITGTPRVAPTDCRMPPPNVRMSAAATAEHGRKLYLLFARHADGLQYVKAGEPAKVGQTLVKEAWTAVEGEPKNSTEASKRYMASPVLREGGNVFHAGDAAGLFVMHKLEPGTPDTDDGWVYATIDRTGTVTAAGRIASCISCHEKGTDDRRFGLR